MSSLFDVINLIHTKEREPTDEEMKDYSAFMGNRAMSQFQDLVFHAQAMNENWNVTKEANFAFYFHSVPKKKRIPRWAKKSKEDEDKIALLKEVYNYSTIKAREMIPLMDQLNLWDHLKNQLNKGGLQSPRKRTPSRT